MVWVWVALVGLMGGVLGSLFGVGGGIIMVPSMVLLLQLPQKTAQGMSLAVMVPMALTASIRYWLQPSTTFDVRQALAMALCAVIGALIGSAIATTASPLVLRRLFAVLLFFVAARMLWK